MFNGIIKLFLLLLVFLSSDPTFANTPTDHFLEIYQKIHTQQRMDHLENLRSNEALPPVVIPKERLQDYKILFVYGFLSNIFDRYQSHVAEDKYTQKLLGFEEGLDYELVPIQSQSSIHVNANIIARSILSSHKPVILLTHSKGSIDTMHALIKYPGLRNHVAGWLSMQGAFQGSEYADTFAKSWKRSIVAWILNKLGGSITSLENLTTQSRKEYITEHNSEIADLLEELPLIQFASYCKPKELNSLLYVVWYFFGSAMAEKANDGMLEVNKAVLSLKDAIVLDGLDHSGSLIHAQYDTNSVTTSLLYLLLEKI